VAFGRLSIRRTGFWRLSICVSAAVPPGGTSSASNSSTDAAGEQLGERTRQLGRTRCRIAAGFDDHGHDVATGRIARGATDVFAGELGSVIEDRG
jgi:hypothetical protein